MVRGGVSLARMPTEIADLYDSKEHYRELLEDLRETLSELQDLLYAQDRWAILLIFQAMDTAGKDGAIKHVMSGVNPQGCQVFSFKQPTHEELDHDFLWRTNKCLPERGRIGIFNRSYYEEVIVTRVHPEILQRQKIPESLLQPNEGIWKGRYRDIVNLEDYLSRNGTRIIKFFLHLSRKEQKKRLLDRIRDNKKNWKMSLGDVAERKFWSRYMEAYEHCLRATSSAAAPWYVVPADDKRNARLIISRIILENLKSLEMRYPRVPREQKEALQKIARQLEREKGQAVGASGNPVFLL